MIRYVIEVFGSVFLLVCGLVVCAHDVSQKEVVNEIAHNYDGIRGYYTNVHGKLTNSITTPKGKKSISERIFSLSDRQSRVVSYPKSDGSASNSPAGQEYVYVTSPRMSFVLSRRLNEPAYLVTSQEKEPADSQSTTKETIHRELRLLGSPYELGTIPLLPLVTHPNCRIEKVELVKKEGRPDAWKLIFNADLRQSKHPGLEKWDKQIEGWVCVVPGQRCVIQSYETRFPGKGNVVISGENEYGLADRGVPLLVRATQKYSIDNLQSEWRVELSEIASGPEPEKLFTMAAYGIVDPSELDRHWSAPLYIWLGAAGLVCCGLVIIMRRRARERG